MSPSFRIAGHLRSNAVAYLALFIALSGTAIALPGKNKVKSDDVARGAIKGKALRDGSVSTPKVRDGAINSAKLANGSVINAKLGDGVITSQKLADDSIVRSKIGAGEVNGGKLANGSVNSAKVNDASLLAEDFAPGQLSDAFAVEAATTDFTIARPGRLFVQANLVMTCAGGGPGSYCINSYALTVDGVEVPGSRVQIEQGETLSNTGEQVSLFGLTGPLEAGEHEIAIEADTSGGSTEGQFTLGAILIQ